MKEQNNPCPCKMCRIEREKGYVCRGNCESYILWVRKEKSLSDVEQYKGKAGASSAEKKVLKI